MATVLRDLYQSVTDQIVAALEAGSPPWVRPWNGGNVDPNPVNAATSRPYRGVNVLLLNLNAMASGFERNRWMTFQQALSLGAHIRKGERGTQVVFFKMHEIDAAPAERRASDERKLIPLLRAFTVFNVDQIDDLPTNLAPPVPETPLWARLDEAERLIEASGAQTRHGGTRAFYSPSEDVIQLPPRQAFRSSSDYYATALHELTHWTGHPARCNRPLGRRHGIEAYAFEELVAEMGAAFLANHCRLPGRLQHDSYIASWLAALRNDKRLVFSAASLAQKAADYLLHSNPREAALESMEAAA